MNFKTPGLYLKAFEPQPVSPVSSAVTGFVGVTEDGPKNQPRLIKNWGEFVDIFGGFVPYAYLPQSVFGFFLNGGELCYVVKVAGSDNFVNAHGLLKDEADLLRMKIDAVVKGKAGNHIRVCVEPFTTKTALRIADDAKDRLVVENIKDFFGSAAPDEFDETLVHETLNIGVEALHINSADKIEHAVILDENVTGDYPVGTEVSLPNRFNIIVKADENVEPLEVFGNLSVNEDSSRYFKTVINSDSQYISVDLYTGSEEPSVGETLLAGGKDPGEIDYRRYTGYENVDNGTYYDPDGSQSLLGLAALENIPDISLVAVPDLERMDHTLMDGEDEAENFKTAQTHILYHCQKMGTRFAVLDPAPGMDPDAPPVFPAKLAKFGALYYPRVTCTIEGKIYTLPSSGFIVGVIAQTDRKFGTYKAPANMKIKGVVDLEVLVDRARQDKLNPWGINCIRKFEDGSIKVWGARTLSDNPERETKWRYINVRRTFLYIIKILSEKLQWAVFEPNDPTLWKRIETTITAFFNTMVAKGKTAGTKPGEAFYVKCNQETNPKEVTEAGQVIVEIGVALSAPAEFIVITVKKTPESLSVIEEEV